MRGTVTFTISRALERRSKHVILTNCFMIEISSLSVKRTGNQRSKVKITVTITILQHNNNTAFSTTLIPQPFNLPLKSLMICLSALTVQETMGGEPPRPASKRLNISFCTSASSSLHRPSVEPTFDRRLSAASRAFFATCKQKEVLDRTYVAS